VQRVRPVVRGELVGGAVEREAALRDAVAVAADHGPEVRVPGAQVAGKAVVAEHHVVEAPGAVGGAQDGDGRPVVGDPHLGAAGVDERVEVDGTPVGEAAEGGAHDARGGDPRGRGGRRGAGHGRGTGGGGSAARLGGEPDERGDTKSTEARNRHGEPGSVDGYRGVPPASGGAAPRGARATTAHDTPRARARASRRRRRVGRRVGRRGVGRVADGRRRVYAHRGPARRGRAMDAGPPGVRAGRPGRAPWPASRAPASFPGPDAARSRPGRGSGRVRPARRPRPAATALHCRPPSRSPA
jgi:hypothetical protein